MFTANILQPTTDTEVWLVRFYFASKLPGIADTVGKFGYLRLYNNIQVLIFRLLYGRCKPGISIILSNRECLMVIYTAWFGGSCWFMKSFPDTTVICSPSGTCSVRRSTRSLSPTQHTRSVAWLELFSSALSLTGKGRDNRRVRCANGLNG